MKLSKEGTPHGGAGSASGGWKKNPVDKRTSI